MQVSGKVAVVTGGASGIGFATARRLADGGANLVLVDVQSDALEQAGDQLRPLTGRLETRLCDVTDRDALLALAQDVVGTFGGVHIVFNNAGVAVGGPIADMTHEDWRWIIDVDLWGPIHGVEAFLPPIRAAGEGGHLLFTSSFAGLVPNVGLGPYCVAKYGVVALAEVLQKELRDENIGVSVLCPMRVGTNIGASERNRQSQYGSPSPAVPDQNEANDDLAGRVLDVDDVAAQVVDAIEQNRLYILPHAESRAFIQRRFARIDRAFDEATGANAKH
jgi:NAD(P)-dependent dehydrogenase (short-subunit alcohol dehydrogenase family)